MVMVTSIEASGSQAVEAEPNNTAAPLSTLKAASAP